MRKNFGQSGEDMKQGERGFMLVGLIVAIFFILLALSVAAPKVAEQLRRDKELEAIHRGNQYVRAIRLYYNKTHTYPGSIEQLEKTNNIRFLRQQYVDPLTGKADWRLIHVGEAKTTVKGFFGQPLAGLTPGLGSAAGMASGAPGSSSPGGSAFGSSSGSSAFGSSSPGGLGGRRGCRRWEEEVRRGGWVDCLRWEARVGRVGLDWVVLGWVVLGRATLGQVRRTTR